MVLINPFCLLTIVIIQPAQHRIRTALPVPTERPNEAKPLLELLLWSQLVGVAALLLSAVGSTWRKTSLLFISILFRS